MLSNLLGLLFAPAFVLLIRYYDLKTVLLGYLVLAIIFFIYKLFKKQRHKDMLMPSIYVVALSVAYYYSSLEGVKYIPVTLSMIFTLVFVDAHLHKKEMILGFTRKFYKKELSQNEVAYLKKGDLYWVFVMMLNTLIHLYVVNYSSDIFWAFYVSVGWYGLFFGALIVQIIYGKFYAV